MTSVDAWTCPTCRKPRATAYCATCGERAIDGRALTLRGLLDELFEALTNIDGRLLRSFRCLVMHPGSLTESFLAGRRKAFVGPVALFLVCNVIFFAGESLTRGLVFTTPLDSHVREQPWNGLAQSLVTQHLAVRRISLEAYAAKFDGAIALHARSLVLLMVVAFTPLVALVFRRSGKPFAAYAVFALHLYAFMLLLFTLATAIPAAGLIGGGVRSASRLLDAILSIALLIACGVYLFVAIGRVFGGGRGARLARATALTVCMAAIVLGYRFVLMLITLYTT